MGITFKLTVSTFHQEVYNWKHPAIRHKSTETQSICICSISPEIDIGQAEGAFVMGLGYWLLEQLQFDPTTGENLTAGTWVRLPKTKSLQHGYKRSLSKLNILQEVIEFLIL